ncbi:unnamed protein product [Protopolystoma xenopodis]|uniref:Uncharacterized protein n=1 Tax=Protopolystoma xenopodis TaxID=117903 RepID=A0A448WHK7_9PLAT|nr:unnamed protein product [Protopolystoma xenopodis]
MVAPRYVFVDVTGVVQVDSTQVFLILSLSFPFSLSLSVSSLLSSNFCVHALSDASISLVMVIENQWDPQHAFGTGLFPPLCLGYLSFSLPIGSGSLPACQLAISLGLTRLNTLFSPAGRISGRLARRFSAGQSWLQPSPSCRL